MSDKLLPCPFCGCRSARPEFRKGPVGEWFVYCPNCAARGPVVYMHHRSADTCIEEAKRLWNRRADHD